MEAEGGSTEERPLAVAAPWGAVAMQRQTWAIILC